MADIEQARAKIVERLGALDAEAAGLRAQLAALDAAIKVARSYEGLSPNDPAPQVTVTPNVIRKRPRNSSHEEVGDAALKVLEGTDAPMSRTDLFKAVQRQGMTIQGQDPEVVFSTMLWRQRERIVNLKGHGYWPASRPYPAAGYDPNDN